MIDEPREGGIDRAASSSWTGRRFAEPRPSSIRLVSYLERNGMILVVFRPGLQSVTDQTGNQPAQGNVLLLGCLPQMDQQIIGQSDLNLQ